MEKYILLQQHKIANRTSYHFNFWIFKIYACLLIYAWHTFLSWTHFILCIFLPPSICHFNNEEKTNILKFNWVVLQTFEMMPMQILKSMKCVYTSKQNALFCTYSAKKESHIQERYPDISEHWVPTGHAFN